MIGPETPLSVKNKEQVDKYWESSSDVLNRLDHRSDCSVFGYFRSNARADFPDDVAKLCLSYYYARDLWSERFTSTGITIKDDVVSYNYNDDGINGRDAVLTTNVTSGQHHWKFKCVKGDHPRPEYDNAYDSIGIIPTLESSIFYDGDLLRYGFIYRNGYFEGDIVEMHLDLDKLKLSYTVNGKDYGKVHDVQPGEYRAAISIGLPGRSWRFLQCW